MGGEVLCGERRRELRGEGRLKREIVVGGLNGREVEEWWMGIK